MEAAHAVIRRFVWTENVLWREELQGRTYGIVLSGRDIIFDAGRCMEYLLEGHANVERSFFGDVQGAELVKAGSMEILWFKHLNHAEVFEVADKGKLLADLVWRYCSS